MRHERLYLADIVEACEAIGRFLKDVERDRFVDDDLIRSAVLQKLSVIGESATRISENLRGEHPKIPWRAIIGFRNVAVHAYFSIDWDIIWVTAVRDVPGLKREIAEILASYPADDTVTGPEPGL
jgi:uncharacterized protein with HEPN domain